MQDDIIITLSKGGKDGAKMNNEKLKAALKYQGAGLSVIPIKPNKKPFIKWANYQTEKASAEQVIGWWEKWPGANPGLVTGEGTGLIVVDADSDKGRDALANYMPDALEIPIAQTPRG